MKNNGHKVQYTEERRLRARRKRKKQIYSILMLTGCLIALVAVMYCGALLWEKLQESPGEDAVEAAAMGEEEITYTRQELEELLLEAENTAREQAASEREEQILGNIRDGLVDGNSVVETLRPLYPEELVLVSQGSYHFVPIREDLKQNDFSMDGLNILESGEYQYLQDGQVISHKGIDVSKFQGDIDWQQVAGDGVEFAFIRVALRGYSTGKLVEDEYFEKNIKGALNAGIRVGVYIYSQAISEEELLEEADFVLEKIAPYEIACPVVYDVERVVGADGRMNDLTVEERTNLTLLFCQTIENAGYKPMIYHNMEMGVLMVDLETLENYDKWFAYYNSDFYYPYEYDIWQYSEKGRVNGIDTDVDLNISFSPFWEE